MSENITPEEPTLSQIADEISRVAFSMRAPNAFTPQFVQLSNMVKMAALRAEQAKSNAIPTLSEMIDSHLTAKSYDPTTQPYDEPFRHVEAKNTAEPVGWKHTLIQGDGDVHTIIRSYKDNPWGQAEGYSIQPLYAHPAPEPSVPAEPVVPEPVYKAVERILDEHSAWIARPNDKVTEKVALAAVIAAHHVIEHVPAEPVGVLSRIEETKAFEEWAYKAGYNMNQHPLHYLFIDDRTFSARQGWKAALRFTHPAPEPSDPVGYLVKDYADGWFYEGNKSALEELIGQGHAMRPLFEHPAPEPSEREKAIK